MTTIKEEQVTNLSDALSITFREIDKTNNRITELENKILLQLTSLTEKVSIYAETWQNDGPPSDYVNSVDPILPANPLSIYDKVSRRAKELSQKSIDELDGMRSHIRLVHGDMSVFEWRGCYFEIYEGFVIIVPEHHSTAWYNLADVEELQLIKHNVVERLEIKIEVLHKVELVHETHS